MLFPHYVLSCSVELCVSCLFCAPPSAVEPMPRWSSLRSHLLRHLLRRQQSLLSRRRRRQEGLGVVLIGPSGQSILESRPHHGLSPGLLLSTTLPTIGTWIHRTSSGGKRLCDAEQETRSRDKSERRARDKSKRQKQETRARYKSKRQERCCSSDLSLLLHQSFYMSDPVATKC